ncbi:MAG: hypothetical protein ABI402_00770 [Ferruginibacter sp.]
MHKKGKLILVILLLYSCNNVTKQTLTAKTLNDSIVKLTKDYTDSTKYIEAIALLRQAIKMDSSYLKSYSNKLFFEETSGRFDSASETLIKMLKLRPDSAELYFKAGLYNDIIGDTVKAQEYYRHSIPRYSILIDTLNKNSQEKNNIQNMMAINIIMMGGEKMLHDYLKENCKTKMDSIFMSAEIWGKTREGILTDLRKKYIR